MHRNLGIYCIFFIFSSIAGSDGEPEDKRSTLAQEKHGAYADTESEEESDDEGSGDDMDVAVGDEPVDPDAEKERKVRGVIVHVRVNAAGIDMDIYHLVHLWACPPYIMYHVVQAR